MKLCNIRIDGQCHLAVETGRGLVDATAAGFAADMDAVTLPIWLRFTEGRQRRQVEDCVGRRVQQRLRFTEGRQRRRVED